MLWKIIRTIIFVSFSIIFLSSCVPSNWRVFGRCDACWQYRCNPRQCGLCICHHCEKICGLCDSKGENCEACWECLRKDACMVN